MANAPTNKLSITVLCIKEIMEVRVVAKKWKKKRKQNKKT